MADTIGQNGIHTWTGTDILMMGWMGPLMGQFGWFANLILPCALIYAAMAPPFPPFVGIVIALFLRPCR